MQRALRILLGLIVALIVVLGGLVVGLNSNAGRLLVAREVNKYAGPSLQISGLGGHFPADIKLRDLQLGDGSGVWLHTTNIELRWQPMKLLRGEVDIAALSAMRVDVLRQPVASGNSGGGRGIPRLRLALDRLEIGTLTLAPSVAEEAIALHVQGAAHVRSIAQASVQLDAVTPDGTAQYHLTAAIDHENTFMRLHVSEPPGGLMGHFAGQQAQGPLTVDVSLAGPRGGAALNFALALGAARLNGSGSLGLVPAQQFADLTLTIPELAPFGALAGGTLGGSSQLHLLVAQTDHGAAKLALDGDVMLRQAPAGLRNFLGPHDAITLRADIRNNNVAIETLHLSGTDFAADVSGKIGEAGVALATSAKINQVALLSPEISGDVMESGSVTGTARDFAVQMKLSGAIGAKSHASGPFSIDFDARHLPTAATGTLTGRGMLENAPLILDATFAQAADGALQIDIGKSQWRSAAASARLSLAQGSVLPTGTASFSISRMQDFSPFLPLKLQGGVSGDFAYTSHEDAKLDLKAANLVVTPALGVLNGTVTAAGPVRALGVKAQFSLSGASSGPARLDFAGVLDIPARAVNLTSLSGTWRGLSANLQGPVAIETEPAVAVRHLKLLLAGGSVALDGVVSPRLNATIALANLPVSIVNNFMPGLGATGTLSADAALTGPLTAPSGTVQLHANGLHIGRGPAAALAPASIAGSAQLAGTSAMLQLSLNAGQDIALSAQGQMPLRVAGTMNLHLRGQVDLRLLDLALAARGTSVRGKVQSDLQLTGTPQSPEAAGSMTLSDGSLENIGSGLNLTQIGAALSAQGRRVTLQSLTMTAGRGSITGQGTLDLKGDMPIALTLSAYKASPITSDMLSETLNGAVTLNGALRGVMTLAGHIDIAKANINLPRGLPPSVANLHIINAGEAPPPAPVPSPPIALDVEVRGRNQIFMRGDGLFAELGGQMHLAGTMAAPDPEGGFDLLRGNFVLAGKSLQFTQGSIGFAGEGFVPTLDLVASVSTAEVSNATLTVGGTAAKPVVTLSSTPPLPSDEILAQLIFGQNASSLTPFQAASLAAALVQISGLGGGIANPLDKVRSALGLDELSLGGSGSGPPSLQAGRYVAPGVYVGATQSANGQGTQVNVQVNLYKGLKLQSATGTSSTGGDSNSVGLIYQFNY